MTAADKIDWYERRDELRVGDVFRDYEGHLVRLDRRVAGDGTKWVVDDWCDGWCGYDRTIEPGDLIEKVDGLMRKLGKSK